MSSQHPPGLVGVPAIDWIYSPCAASLQYLRGQLPEGSAWVWRFGNSQPIARKRNECVRDLLGRGRFRWLLFLDSDLIFPRDTISRLLAVDADVVGGLYLTKTREPDYAPVAGHVTHQPEDAPADRPTDHPRCRQRCLDLRKVGDDGLGVCEVDVMGTGCMLIYRHVLEELSDPWFVANERHVAGFAEDYNFCLRAKRAGFSIKVDTGMGLRHVGPHGIGVPEARGHVREKAPPDRTEGEGG